MAGTDLRPWFSAADARVKLSWFIALSGVVMVPSPTPLTLPLLAVVPLLAFIGGVHRIAPWLALVAVPLFLGVLGLAGALFEPGWGWETFLAVLIRWAAMIYGALYFVATT